MTDHTIL